jgi:hypothetical protein
MKDAFSFISLEKMCWKFCGYLVSNGGHNFFFIFMVTRQLGKKERKKRFSSHMNMKGSKEKCFVPTVLVYMGEVSQLFDDTD